MSKIKKVYKKYIWPHKGLGMKALISQTHIIIKRLKPLPTLSWNPLHSHTWGLADQSAPLIAQHDTDLPVFCCTVKCPSSKKQCIWIRNWKEWKVSSVLDPEILLFFRVAILTWHWTAKGSVTCLANFLQCQATIQQNTDKSVDNGQLDPKRDYIKGCGKGWEYTVYLLQV